MKAVSLIIIWVSNKLIAWFIFYENTLYSMARTYGVVVCGYLNATSHYTRVNVTKKSKTSQVEVFGRLTSSRSELFAPCVRCSTHSTGKSFCS